MLKLWALWSGYLETLEDFFFAPRTGPCLSALSLVVARVFKCQLVSIVANHRHGQVIRTC
jgi:hypothetical protein